MLHVCFDEAAFLAAGGTVKTECVGKPGEQYDRKRLYFERHVFDYNSDGRLYTMMGGALTNYELPEELRPFVVEASHYDNFGYGMRPHRQLGFYRYKSATAELSETGGKDAHYHVKFLGKSVEDVKELNFLLREGKIWPAIDYEQAQVPPPARHLRQLFGEAWALIRREVSDRFYRIKQSVLV